VRSWPVGQGSVRMRTDHPRRGVRVGASQAISRTSLLPRTSPEEPRTLATETEQRAGTAFQPMSVSLQRTSLVSQEPHST